MTPGDQGTLTAATRVVLRPLATPLPLGFLALALVTTVFSALQLGWIPPTQGRIAGLTAVVAAVLQLLAAVLGYLSRDPVAGTGVALQSGTWAVVGLTSLLSAPRATSPGLGVLLVSAAVALLVPAAAGRSKLVPATVLAVTAVRFAVTGGYELSASPEWEAAAGMGRAGGRGRGPLRGARPRTRGRAAADGAVPRTPRTGPGRRHREGGAGRAGVGASPACGPGCDRPVRSGQG